MNDLPAQAPHNRAVATGMYTFLYVSPTGELPSFDFAACPDAEAAYQNAKLLLARWPEREAVEVWDDTERLCVVQRSGAQPRSPC